MPPGDVRSAYAGWAGAVTLLTIADGRDDVGATISAFCPVSFEPPLVLVSLMAESYLAELFLPRGDDPPGDPPASQEAPPPDTPWPPIRGGSPALEDRAPRGRDFAVTLLAAEQRMLAGRFAAEGRPSARLMLDDVPHRRGEISGALIPDGGLAAIECSTEQQVAAGDHVLVIARVTAVPYVADTGSPLVRFRNRYLPPG
jgi:flavin reductase (DIM6/NTAB) family NADH-FMN oxidoreductase RutF